MYETNPAGPTLSVATTLTSRSPTDEGDRLGEARNRLPNPFRTFNDQAENSRGKVPKGSTVMPSQFFESVSGAAGRKQPTIARTPTPKEFETTSGGMKRDL